MLNEPPIVGDATIERQIFAEFAGALETLSGSYRRAILTLEKLGPDLGALCRYELRAATYGTIRAAEIALSLLEPPAKDRTMKLPGWLHTVLTIAAGVALVAAHTVIPASLMIPGINIGVGTALIIATGLAASLGIDGSKVAATIGTFVGKGSTK